MTNELGALAKQFKFEAHNIGTQVDSTGHYAIPFTREFPLIVRLFHYKASRFTRGATWHEQLELFCPIDGRVDVQMGNQLVQLAPGDLLVMDNLKLHHVVDCPGLNARVVVISFLPELVYSLGSLSHDFAFLLPFYTQLESQSYVLRASDQAAPEASSALINLLGEFFAESPAPHREVACKARLLNLLLIILRRFQGAAVLRWEFERRRQLAQRFSRLIELLQIPGNRKPSLTEAAKTCGMSPAKFTRSFRQAAGMSYLAYVTHLRLSEVSRLLRASDRSIAEIADATGFADQSHLDRHFKRAFGMTPRKFRQGQRHA
ncbi:MAG TPA: helix-turn-helix transcriptional regulator [Verrucomicrobiae bacterium]|nr:helix-turn-helix transcriptional regulator [Verrucomicrobiae bacterium]